MRFVLAAAVTLCGLTGLTAAEWEKTSPFYEDDAWYDISEWFDGNDYNPTDEEFGEWDDEVFQYDNDLDNDNDWYYGYDGKSTDDNWFYDYYDGAYTYHNYQPDNKFYEYGSRYLDYDNDGSYDAYATWYDWDADGYYDDYNYYTFNKQGKASQEKRAKELAPAESRSHQISGKIRDKKDVIVRNATHVVVSLKSEKSTDGAVFADLGPAAGIDELHLNKGDQITVTGPKAKVGEADVLIAQQVESGSRKIEIQRPRRSMKGQVVNTHPAKVRGKEHLVALVDTGDKRKVAVDLGPMDRLQGKVKQNSTLTFQGVPLKVQDRKLIFADKVTVDGKDIWIDRSKTRPSSEAAASK